MVMATGIVLIAAFLLGMVSVAVILFAVNIAAYLVLGLLTILQLVWFPRAFLSDLVDHERGPGFLTSVAGSCVLGSQFILVANNYDVALALWVLGTIEWIILIYGIFAALSSRN
jgi:tellurite resistance protein TehA-like permease